MTNITQEYLSYSELHAKDYGKNIIVLLKVGAFYEMYGIKNKEGKIIGSMVEDICKICDLQLSERSNMFYKKMPVLIAGFRDYTLEKYVQQITNNNFICFVYDQYEKDKKFYRELTNIYSQGTYFEISGNNLNNVIMCLWFQKISNNIVFGISHVNILTGQSYLYEYQQELIISPTMIDDLERYISIYKPSEIIVITNIEENEYSKIKNLINFETENVRTIFIYKNDRFCIEAQNCEKQTYIKTIINEIFKPNDYNSFIEDYYYHTISLQSYCFLLNWISNHNSSLLSRIETPKIEKTKDILHLANHSLKQLNIINNDTNKKNNSLLSLLNNCLTPMGKRLFTNILLHPITDDKKLNIEYDYTEKLVNQFEIVELIREDIKNIYDMEKYQRQLYLKKINLRNILRIYDNLSSLNHLYESLSSQYSFVIDYINYYLHSCNNIFDKCKEIILFLEKSINLNECKKNDTLDELTFQKGYDTDLDEIINETNENLNNFKQIQDYIQETFISYEKKNLQYVKIHTTDKMAPTLICTKKRSEILNKHFKSNKKIIISKEIVLDSTFTFSKSTGGNVSIDHPFIHKTAHLYLAKKNLLIKKLEEVFEKFLDEFKEYHYECNKIMKFAALVDVLQNKVYIAKKNNYSKPEINYTSESFVNIKGLRHPLIEKINQDEIYVKNDINLDSERYGMLLFGTNAVGKTSFMKAVGIAVIMAQSGLFVACDKMVFSPYNQMFTRILNNDNMFKGLSTFAVEMSELRVILKMADKNSIVLGDELCSGTEYESASSIFVSGIQWLESKKATFIFASHLHNITTFKEIENLKNITCNHMSVFYDIHNDCLVYDRILKDGSGDSVYGLEVCKSLHLPNDFLENAYLIRNKYFKQNKNNFLLQKQSRYNSKKVILKCEICSVNPGTETHHLIPQRNANKDNFIDHYHKNHIANLSSICEECHNKIHAENYELKKVKTTKGYSFSLINNS